MAEKLEHAAENILNNLKEVISDHIPHQKSGGSSEEQHTISSQMKRIFGRQNSIHKVLGGGKSADVLLWRNKKISSSALTAATAVWVVFEWLNYHLLSLVAFALIIGMIGQFIWTNASGMLSGTQSKVPRLVIPDEMFVNIAIFVGAQINHFLGFIQDVACGKSLKKFIMVVVGLWAAAIIGSWCNFLTVLYIGFVSAHILPVVYEKYEDQVDEFLYNLLGQLQEQYQKLDEAVLSKIPKEDLHSKDE